MPLDRPEGSLWYKRTLAMADVRGKVTYREILILFESWKGEAEFQRRWAQALSASLHRYGWVTAGWSRPASEVHGQTTTYEEF